MPKIGPFEEHSDEYDQWFASNHDLYEAELKAIRQLLPPPGADGLEVGVGSGMFAAPLGVKTGVEPSERMSAKARKKGITVYPGTAENLPFADDRFDFVLMVTTICFVDDVLQSFNEAFRVLRPKGAIVVAFVDRESEIGRQYLAQKDKDKFYKIATFFSTREVTALLKKAGLKITEIRQTLVPGEATETVLDGYGKGSFVVVKGVK